MDLSATHSNGTPLNFNKLIDFDDQLKDALLKYLDLRVSKDTWNQWLQQNQDNILLLD